MSDDLEPRIDQCLLVLKELLLLLLRPNERPAVELGWRAIPIDDLALSVRLENGIAHANAWRRRQAQEKGEIPNLLMTAGDLADISDRDFLRLPNLGRRSLAEMREVIANLANDPASP